MLKLKQIKNLLIISKKRLINSNSLNLFAKKLSMMLRRLPSPKKKKFYFNMLLKEFEKLQKKNNESVFENK